MGYSSCNTTSLPVQMVNIAVIQVRQLCPDLLLGAFHHSVQVSLEGRSAAGVLHCLLVVWLF